MKTIETVGEMTELAKAWRKEGKQVGLVPTMGYLHQGHLSLAKAAKLDCDIVVMSIFVNPTQFGPNEDYEAYPRDLSHDQALAESVGVDYLFAPQPNDMYPKGYSTFVNVEGVTDHLCGAKRPGHFRGVATVVSKLFHIVQPEKAYFGQKDGQQVAVLRRMVRDLNMPVEIIARPIVREGDGVALSSRNVYLTDQQRQQAVVLSQGLAQARELFIQGERDSEALKKVVTDVIASAPLAKIDYVELVDGDTMASIDRITGKAMLAVAVYFGNTRLIDNLILEVESESCFCS